MDGYDPITWPILAMRSPNSLDFLEGILSSDEAIFEVINIWLYPPKDIFCGATGSILGLNPLKNKSIIDMFLDLSVIFGSMHIGLGYPSVKMYLNLFQPKIAIGSNLLENGGSAHHICIFHHSDRRDYQTWDTLVSIPFPFWCSW